MLTPYIEEYIEQKCAAGMSPACISNGQCFNYTAGFYLKNTRTSSKILKVEKYSTIWTLWGSFWREIHVLNIYDTFRNIWATLENFSYLSHVKENQIYSNLVKITKSR